MLGDEEKRVAVGEVGDNGFMDALDIYSKRDVNMNLIIIFSCLIQVILLF